VASKKKLVVAVTGISVAVAAVSMGVTLRNSETSNGPTSSTLTAQSNRPHPAALSASPTASGAIPVALSAAPNVQEPRAQGSAATPGEVGFRNTKERHAVSNRGIVRFTAASQIGKVASARGWPQVNQALSNAAGVPIRIVREQGQHFVIQIDLSSALATGTQDSQTAAGELMQLALGRLRNIDGVMDAQDDPLLFPSAVPQTGSSAAAPPIRRRAAGDAFVPNDAQFAEQWYVQNGHPGAANAQGAWTVTSGKTVAGALVIAVVDTGITRHSDLDANVLPGFDFVSDAVRANDGNGWDADPSDPGDWTSAAESLSESLRGCRAEDSSWHGTHVAGIAASVGNNGNGVAGVAYGAKILPVRALGKCGGYATDIASAILWASGAPVEGAATNPNPAHVINLSLGGVGACPASIQAAINEAVSRGSIVVAAAGNDAIDARNSAPANCTGVISVGAVSRTGERAGYSNFGSRIAISAPGGDSVITGVNGTMLSTLNSGKTSPASETYAWYEGTSMAAPVISGGVALLMAQNPRLSPGMAMQILARTAKPYPSGTGCAKLRNCGVGIVDLGKAVGIAQNFRPDIVVGRVVPRSPIMLPNTPFDVTAVLSNIGSAKPDATDAIVGLYLSANPDGSNPSKLAEVKIANINALAPNAQMPLRFTKVVPRMTVDDNAQSATYYLFVRVDGGDWELRRDNNSSQPMPFDLVIPDVKLSLKQPINQAPSEILFLAEFNDPRVHSVAMQQGWQYAWHFPSGRVAKADRNVARVFFDAPTKGAAQLTVSQLTSGFSRTATLEYEVKPAAPYVFTINASTSNPHGRAPLLVRLKPEVSGGHPQDRIVGISWSVDDSTLVSNKLTPVFSLDAGEHRIQAEVVSKFNRIVRAEKVIQVAVNQPPVCAIDYTSPSSEQGIVFTANCGDADGVIKSVLWTINGRAAQPTLTNPYVLRRGVTGHGTMVVNITATDDSGEGGTAQVTVAY
jgi:subtilisin family serine protease